MHFEYRCCDTDRIICPAGYEVGPNKLAEEKWGLKEPHGNSLRKMHTSYCREY